MGSSAECAKQLLTFLDAGANEILLHGSAPKDMGPLTDALRQALAGQT